MTVSGSEGNIPGHVLLFDGFCNLCNSSVNLILKYDHKKVIKFASLQSPSGINLIKKFSLEKLNNKTIILIKDGIVFHHSTAVLKVFKILGGGWSILYGFIIIPRPVRDYIYSIIARNRAKWFGMRANCRIPTPEEMDRFIQ